MSDKFILIHTPSAVEQALKAAAQRRRLPKVALIERLLCVIVRDNLINAVLDDKGGVWNDNAVKTTPTSPS